MKTALIALLALASCLPKAAQAQQTLPTPNWAARLFQSSSSPADVDQAFHRLKLRRYDEGRSQWTGGNDKVTVFVNISRSLSGKSNDIYLVAASTSGAEADWQVQQLQNELKFDGKITLSPPPGVRGQGVIQWCQIRERSGNKIDPKTSITAALAQNNWNDVQWGNEACWATKGYMRMLLRWQRLPNNQIRYFVFVYLKDDPQKNGNTACISVAQNLMSTPI